MHPVLFEIPLPSWPLPLAPALFALAGVGLVCAAYGKWRGAFDLLALGSLLALVGVVGGVLGRGQRLLLESLPVYSYGALLCASLVVGWSLTLRLGMRDGFSRELLANCYFVTAVAALVGSRVLYVVTNLAEFHDPWAAFALRRGGLVAYGGFIGGFIGSLGYLRRRGRALLPWADAAVPSLASGLLLTRLGCYLFGCDFGRPLPAEAPAWLRRLGTFPRWPMKVLDGSGSPAWLEHVDLRGLSLSAKSSLPVHPTQLYEALGGALLFVLTWRLRGYARFRGQVFLAFTFGYAYLRLLLEVLRGDSERGFFGPRLQEHAVVPALLLLLASAFAYGPAWSIEVRTKRHLAVGLAFAFPAIAYFGLRPRSLSGPTLMALSTSQWIALVTALVASFAWRRLGRAVGRDRPHDDVTNPVPAPL